MHSGVFRHISSMYLIEALLFLSTKGSSWSSRYIDKSIKFWYVFKSVLKTLVSMVTIDPIEKKYSNFSKLLTVLHVIYCKVSNCLVKRPIQL